MSNATAHVPLPDARGSTAEKSTESRLLNIVNDLDRISALVKAAWLAAGADAAPLDARDAVETLLGIVRDQLADTRMSVGKLHDDIARLDESKPFLGEFSEGTAL